MKEGSDLRNFFVQSVTIHLVSARFEPVARFEGVARFYTGITKQTIGVTLMTSYYAIGREIEGRILLRRDNGYITTYDNLSDAQAKAKKMPGWSVYSLKKLEVEDKKEDEKVEKKDEKTIKIDGVIKDLFENYKNMVKHVEDNDKVGLKIDLNNYRKFVNRLNEINEGRR